MGERGENYNGIERHDTVFRGPGRHRLSAANAHNRITITTHVRRNGFWSGIVSLTRNTQGVPFGYRATVISGSAAATGLGLSQLVAEGIKALH